MKYAHLIPIQTRRLETPQDNFYTALSESLPALQERDVLVVASKALSIHEGRCVPVTDENQVDILTKQETNTWLPSHLNQYGFMLTIIHHALIANAGIDSSNSGNYLTLLPKNPTQSAKELHQFLKEKYGLKELGVIVTDSHVTPLRWGTTGISIGGWGVAPLHDYRGTADVYGNTMRVSQANMWDSLATAAVNIMGEGNEQTPAVIARHWPKLHFEEKDFWQDYVIEPKADVFWPLLKIFEESKDKEEV